MARVNYQAVQEAAKNNGGGEFGFLKLADRGTIKVRFLIDDLNELDCYQYHTVDVVVDGVSKKRNIDCNRALNEPVQNCAFCSANYPVRNRVYIWLHDLSTNQVILWEQPASIIDTLQGHMQRVAGKFSSNVFEIVRNGLGLQTKYTIFPCPNEVLTEQQLIDFDKIDIQNRLVFTKTNEEMQSYINTGSFGVANTAAPQQPTYTQNDYAPRATTQQEQPTTNVAPQQPVKSNW